MLGLCLAAIFALLAVAAASASAAEPEWGRCLNIVPKTGKAQTKGNYTEAKCQTVAVKVTEKKGKKTEKPDHKGAYEWYPGVEPLCYKEAKAEYKYKNNACTEIAEKKGVPDSKGKYELGPGPKFKGAGGASVLISNFADDVRGNQLVSEFGRKPSEGVNPFYPEEYYGYSIGINEIECTSETAEGELSGTKGASDVHVVFHGCHYGGDKCYNLFKGGNKSEPEEGEIAVNELEGELGYINKANKEVGVVLHPVGTPTAPATSVPFVEFECNHGALFVVVGKGGAENKPPQTNAKGEWENSFGHAVEEPWYYHLNGKGEPEGGNDGIISPITPVDQMTSEYTQEYKVDRRVEEGAPFPKGEAPALGHSEEAGLTHTNPENVPTRFEGGARQDLEGWLGGSEEVPMQPEYERFSWSPAGEIVTNVNKGEGEVEIKA